MRSAAVAILARQEEERPNDGLAKIKEKRTNEPWFYFSYHPPQSCDFDESLMVSYLDHFHHNIIRHGGANSQLHHSITMKLLLHDARGDQTTLISQEFLHDARGGEHDEERHDRPPVCLKSSKPPPDICFCFQGIKNQLLPLVVRQRFIGSSIETRCGDLLGFETCSHELLDRDTLYFYQLLHGV